MDQPDHESKLDLLRSRKSPDGKICALTSYDAPTARILDAAGIDIQFVGDSVGTNVLGYRNEREVTLDDIVHHVGAVRRGAPGAVVLADLPYRTYETPDATVANATRLVAAGASLVKVEGADQAANIQALVGAGITVCAHLGFTPQTLSVDGARARVQARSVDDAMAVIDAADALERAGASFLVLELVPSPVSQIVTQRLGIPTIGIGAGPHCDGQVLIVYDILGLSGLHLRLAREYANGQQFISDAVSRYREDVSAEKFPSVENSFSMDSDAEAALLAAIAKRS